MDDKDLGRVVPTGLSQAEPEDSLGPTGFDPSRMCWAAVPVTMLEVSVRVANTIEAADVSSVASVDAMTDAQLLRVRGLGNTGLAFLRTAADEARWKWQTQDARFIDLLKWVLRDSDGSPKGGDACGSVHDSAGRNGIAIPLPSNPE